MKKKIVSLIISVGSILFFVTPVFAHIVVTPKQVGIAQTQVFDMSVPTEKDNPTTALKLLIPKGVEDVTPNVKPGWTIHIVKNGDTVTEIDWTQGSIPPGQRDDFFFKAQAPAQATTLKWKAYQTYSDGSIVAWDHLPTVNPEDDSAPPPYSTTKVVDDLTSSAPASMQANQFSSSVPVILSVVAIIMSLFSVGAVLKRRA